MSGTEQGNTIVKNILILEDEPAALRYLVKIVEDCSPLELQFTVSSGLHSVLERPFSEANGHPFFVKKSLLSVC